MAKITVITPVFNGEKFLAAALDSLLAQSFPDWNLVVVDDGSTDSTPEILASCQDERIRVIRQANGGEASARNTGLDAADGEYIAFLDADDLYLPNALADTTSYLDSHPDIAVVFSDGYLCDENGKTLTRLTEHRPGIHQGNILEPLVLDSAVVTVPICTLTRRSAILQSGARFDRSLVIGPDWDFWIQLAVNHSFGYVDQLTCKYRVHQTNVTRTSGMQKRKHDLAAGRIKVLNAPWFSNLSAETRFRFFYHLLIELLSGDTSRQLEVLEGEKFKCLPAADQPHLWRLAALDKLKRGVDAAGAESMLARSLEIYPGVAKTAWILHLVRFNPSLARGILLTWEWGYFVVKSIKYAGTPRPKPVPILPASH
jgi:glycosyltransferase involved in cell wall biosynthesis